MSEIKYAELLRLNRELGEALTGTVHPVAVLSNVIANPLKEVLEFTLRSRGLKAELVFGDYDNVVQESARLAAHGTVIVMMDAANLVDGLQGRAALMEAAEIAALVARVKAELDLTIRNLAQTRLVLINTFSPLFFTSHELRDGAIDRICDELNAHLRKMAPSNFLIVPVDRVLAQAGTDNGFDERYFYSSRAPYSRAFLACYAEQVAPAILSAAGLAKKVLVFDCDNTLWKGVLGEDGEDGISMAGATPEGAPFAEVQRLVLELQQEGVLIGLCSKNNPQDVDNILASHPDMVLKEKHLAIKKVNWNDKATNLREIARELNVGLDSIVFVDDSEFELNLVREQLPSVHLVKVPAEHYRYPRLIRKVRRLFFNLSRTSEDRSRTDMYRQEAQRQQASAAYASIDDYLRSLDLQVAISVDDPSLVPRMAQMTQKTNQFNLTTRRYTEAEMQKHIADREHLVAAFSVADKFGDYGITGLAIVGFSGETAVMDTLLMSCRVLGRNVERVVMDELVALARDRGAQELKAEYRKTSKNAQVEKYYDGRGFRSTESTSAGTTYTMALADYKPSGIDYIKVRKEHGRTD